jgi:DNA-binding PadR family transcriptional regulator
VVPVGSAFLNGVDLSGIHVYNVSMTDSRSLGTLEQQILLAILKAGEEAYPPLILQRVEEGTGRAVSRGSVYVTLDRMEKKGLISSTLGPRDPKRGGHPRRNIALTETGLASLRETRESLQHFLHDLDAVLEP